MTDYSRIKGIVLEGGGPLGIAHLGGLKVLESKGILKQLKYFEGVSAGAIIATGMACNATVDFMKEEIMKVDFNTFLDDSYGFVRDLARMLKSYGWYKGEVIEEWCGDLIGVLTGKRDCTFKELYDKTGNFLELNAVNINTGKSVYFNHETRPDLTLKKAIRYSLSIPFFYKCESESTCYGKNEDGTDKCVDVYYVDGGVLDNLPFHRLDRILEKDEIIGQKLVTSKDMWDIKNPYIDGTPQPPSDIIEFMKVLMGLLRDQALKIHVKEDDWKRTIAIDVEDVSSTDFSLENDTKRFLFDQGEKCANKYFDKA